METPTPQKTSLHPALWIAAIAITLFSLVGIAALTGLLPSSKSEPAASQVAAVEPPPPPPMPAAEPEPTPAPQPATTTPAPVPEKKAAAKPAPKHKETASYSSKPKGADEHTATYAAQPAPPPPCPDCAVISAITPITEKGEGTGLGAIAGGILGGVIGNQIGGGSGRDVARIAGIAGGAYAGHQVEKSQRSHTVYDITVHFVEDNSTQVVRENAEPIWQVGDKVRVQNGKLVPR